MLNLLANACTAFPSELQEVKRQVTELLHRQLIEPYVSPLGAPVSPLSMPLTLLLRNNTPCAWAVACQEAFDRPEDSSHHCPMPSSPRGSPLFGLVSSAFSFGPHTVLIQEGRPIAFWSRKLVNAEQN